MQKLLNEMIEHCNALNLDISLAKITYTTFLNLVEVQKLWDVGWGSKANILFITARRSKNSPLQFFFAVPSSKSFTISDVEDVQKVLEVKRLTMAIVSPNSTVLFYEIAEGLANKGPEVSEKLCNDSYLRDNRKFLLSQGLWKITKSI